MQLKSYFSGTVEAAMELARKELGEDALLVNARPATPETRYLGAYEVVFGVVKGPRVAQAPEVPKRPLVSEPFEEPATGGLALEFAELKREVERMAQRLNLKESSTPSPSPDSSPPLPLHSLLIERDLDPALARSVVEGARIETLFETDSHLGIPGTARPVAAFVGPPGAGKTVSMIKIAARYGLDARTPTRIISSDVHRIAAADQLRSLSLILGIGCDIAETPAALAQLIEEHRSKGLVLIDTPGFSRAEMEDSADLARLIQTHPEIDTHLVLPASMRPADMSRAIGQYLPFGPKKLLFTRIDETQQHGALISIAHRWSLPISFLGIGQQIPDDIEPATQEGLTKLILGEEAIAQTAPDAPLRRGAAA